MNGAPGKTSPLDLALAWVSMALACTAQLAMRWGMMHLPAPSKWVIDGTIASLDPGALAAVGGAMAAYAASMLCWMTALRSVPLARAYALLGVSYILVYLAAAMLPSLGGQFTPLRTTGVLLVVIGVFLTGSASSHAPRRTSGS